MFERFHAENSPVSNPVRPASGGSLGALLILLDLRPETLAHQAGNAALTDAVTRCLTCPTHATCARWQADDERRPDAWRSFCPNGTLLAAPWRRSVRVERD